MLEATQQSPKSNPDRKRSRQRRAVEFLDDSGDQHRVSQADRVDAVDARFEVQTSAAEHLIQRGGRVALRVPDDRVDPGVQNDADAPLLGSSPDAGQVTGVGLGVEQRRAARVVGVLDVATDGARVKHCVDEVARGQVVPALEVGGHRHADGGRDLPQLGERGLAVSIAVRSATNRGHRHARRGDHRAAGGLHRLGTGGVPDVHEQQGSADLVKVTQSLSGRVESCALAHRCVLCS
jgi:hypothetical protein